jgi:hypothetical protein
MSENKLIEEIQNLRAYIEAQEKTIQRARGQIRECEKKLEGVQRQKWLELRETATIKELATFLHGYFEGSTLQIQGGILLIYKTAIMDIAPDGRYSFSHYNPRRNLRNVSLDDIERDCNTARMHLPFGSS